MVHRHFTYAVPSVADGSGYGRDLQTRDLTRSILERLRACTLLHRSLDHGSKTEPPMQSPAVVHVVVCTISTLTFFQTEIVRQVSELLMLHGPWQGKLVVHLVSLRLVAF